MSGYHWGYAGAAICRNRLQDVARNSPKHPKINHFVNQKTEHFRYFPCWHCRPPCCRTGARPIATLSCQGAAVLQHRHASNFTHRN